MITRRRYFQMSAAAMAAAFGNAFMLEPNLLSTTKREIFIKDLDPELDGFTIAHLTDFHYKPDKDHKLMQKVVRSLEQNPVDLIALTGDFVDHDAECFPALLDHLKRPKATYGTVACLGNHDGWCDLRSYYKKALEAEGIPLLSNENFKLETSAKRPLYIAGTDYVWKGKPNAKAALHGIPEDASILALVHEPDYFDVMRAVRKIDLQLSGHTHGGQCRVPFFGYAPAKVNFGKLYIYDRYERDASQIFVSRGVGTTGVRVRFACPPELARITLRRQV
ncbi:metallophosphoesterase [Rubritalea marina]|uniref:metallophosphoesterase n=1 Tax=Rubritalea marina TaxID=361055 RepID=UPI00037A626E|nr:metallophosphoesterase [Rubritalea marina]